VWRERRKQPEGTNLTEEDTVTFATGNVQLKGGVCTEFMLFLVPQGDGNAGRYCKAIGKLSGIHTGGNGAPRGVGGGFKPPPPPPDSEGPPKSCQTQPDYENC